MESAETGTGMFSPDGSVAAQLGEWFKKQYQQSDWYLESDHNILYHLSKGAMEQHTAHIRARLRFTTRATAYDRPARATHIIETNTRPRFVEITEKWKIPPQVSTQMVQVSIQVQVSTQMDHVSTQIVQVKQIVQVSNQIQVACTHAIHNMSGYDEKEVQFVSF
jgi:hypothetical protein